MNRPFKVWRLRIAVALAALVVLPLCGCYMESLLSESVYGRRRYGEQTADGELRQETRNLLGNFLLNEQVYENPQNVIRELNKLLEVEPNRTELIMAIADVASFAGGVTGDEKLAGQFFLTAAFFAYWYINIDMVKDSGYSLNRMASIRIYDRAVTELFAYLKSCELWRRDAYQMTMITGQSVRFLEPLFQLPFGRDHYRDFLLCANYRVTGMPHVSTQFGIGAPLVALPVNDKQEAPAIERWDTEMPSPATLIIRFYREADLQKNPDRILQARLEFIRPQDLETVKINQKELPLALDFSTPLAYQTMRPPLLNRIKFMIDPAAGEMEAGLYFLEEFNPNKIPVVLVHGLLSNHRTWIQMINSLQNDPLIRKHFQFWFFSYSSGNPVLFSGKMLRDALTSVRRNLVEDKLDTTNFDRMVLVGHSMGGLLCRTAMLTNHGEVELNMLGCRTLAELCDELPPEQGDMLKSMLYFDRLKFVQRVVFVSVPHRGSELAMSWIGAFGRRLIKLPGDLSSAFNQVLETLVQKHDDVNIDLLTQQNGIDNLNPTNGSLQLLNRMKLPADLPYHSIIGNRAAADTPNGSDGIVPYWSAHLDGAQSELIVKSGHSAQENQLAIQEVRRILLEHLRSYNIMTDSQKNFTWEELDGQRNQSGSGRAVDDGKSFDSVVKDRF